jgi:hypothetical protein
MTKEPFSKLHATPLRAQAQRKTVEKRGLRAWSAGVWLVILSERA